MDELAIGYENVIEPELECCDYCSKPGATFKGTIRRNGWDVDGIYCDNTCKSYAQMSAEG